MPVRRPKIREQDLAAIVVAWLEALGADVYQEVEVSGGVADIVAVVRAETWIVEVKTSASLALLVQATERRRLAHRVYVAAPYARGSAPDLCRELGIGVLEVHPDRVDMDAGEGFGRPAVRVIAESGRWNSRPVALRQKLKPEHKTHAKAGAASAAGRWTPFRDTSEQLARLVRAEPGIGVKAAIDKIRHHYANGRSARATLVARIKQGIVAGVELRREAGALTLHPTGGQR